MTCSNTERLQNRSLRFFRAAIIHVEGLGLSIHARSMRARALFTVSTVETDMVNSQQGRFVWYELMTTDMEAAKAFYADVVGWGTKDASIPGMAYTLFTAGDVSVSGLMDLPEDARRMGAQPNWIGYVGTDDVDAATARIRHLGGAVHVPPKDIPSVSRFSVVADPQMVTLGLLKWLKPGQDQPAEPGAPGRVGWYELLATDREQALAFYGEVFGWQKADAADVSSMGTYQLFSAGGQTVGGMFTKPSMVPAPFWLYYFNIEDIDAAAERVKAGGGQILKGPVKVPSGGWIVQCTDPQGAMFALIGGRALTSEIGWSTEWSGLSSNGRLLVTGAAPRSHNASDTPSGERKRDSKEVRK